jgi:segregation and condensation protein A
MMKDNRVIIKQSESFGEIYLSRVQQEEKGLSQPDE